MLCPAPLLQWKVENIQQRKKSDLVLRETSKIASKRRFVDDEKIFKSAGPRGQAVQAGSIT